MPLLFEGFQLPQSATCFPMNSLRDDFDFKEHGGIVKACLCNPRGSSSFCLVPPYQRHCPWPLYPQCQTTSHSFSLLHFFSWHLPPFDICIHLLSTWLFPIEQKLYCAWNSVNSMCPVSRTEPSIKQEVTKKWLSLTLVADKPDFHLGKLAFELYVLGWTWRKITYAVPSLQSLTFNLRYPLIQKRENE